MAHPSSSNDTTLAMPPEESLQDEKTNIADGDRVEVPNPRSSKLEPSDEQHSFSGNDTENRYLRLRCSAALAIFNAQNLITSAEERATAWHKLIEPFHPTRDQKSPAPLVKSPFYLDYGNVAVSPSAYIHRNVYISDNPHPQARVTIGADTFIGPGVHILSIRHEVDWRKRDGVMGPAVVAGMNVGDNVYIGAGACIMPGVTIGEGAVIGAGAVVTKSVPAGHVAVGNPARVARKVALDVLDDPGLCYELWDGKMMVVDCCSLISRYTSPYRPGLGLPAGKSKSEETSRTVYQSAGSRVDRERFTEDVSPRSTDSSAIEHMQWLSPSAEPGERQTRGEVDVALFLMAVGIGGWIVHAVLY